MGRYYYKFSPEGWNQYSSDSNGLHNKIEDVWHAFTTVAHLNRFFGFTPPDLADAFNKILKEDLDESSGE